MPRLGSVFSMTYQSDYKVNEINIIAHKALKFLLETTCRMHHCAAFTVTSTYDGYALVTVKAAETYTLYTRSH